MDTLFENKTAISERNLKEMTSKLFEQNKRYAITRIFSAVIILALIAYSFFSLDFLLASITSAALIFILVTGWVRGRSGFRKRFQKTLLRLYPSGSFQFRFNEHGFGLDAREGKGFTYSQITKFCETQNLWLIMIEESVLFFEKDGFIQGDSAHFGAFIKNKVQNS